MELIGLKLESCPFCGSNEVVDHILIQKKILFIKCIVCECTGPSALIDPTKPVIESVELALEQASTYWNRRSP